MGREWEGRVGVDLINGNCYQWGEGKVNKIKGVLPSFKRTDLGRHIWSDSIERSRFGKRTGFQVRTLIRRRKCWGIQEEEERNRLSLEIYLLLKRLPYYRVLLLALSSTDQLEKNGRNSCFYKRRNAGARLAGANTIALKRSVRVFTKQEK